MTTVRIVLSLIQIAVLAWLFVELARLRREQRRRDELNRRLDEAIALTEPVGPEDSPEWGQR